MATLYPTPWDGCWIARTVSGNYCPEKGACEWLGMQPARTCESRACLSTRGTSSPAAVSGAILTQDSGKIHFDALLVHLISKVPNALSLKTSDVDANCSEILFSLFTVKQITTKPPPPGLEAKLIAGSALAEGPLCQFMQKGVFLKMSGSL